jgi:flagellar motor protein MotB
LISFADNVALLMGFFVILFTLAISSKSTGAAGGADSKSAAAGAPDPAWLDTVIEIRDAFNNPVSANSTDPRDHLLVQRLRQRLGMTDVTDEGQSGRDREVKSLKASQYFAISGMVTFTEGTSELDDEGKDDVKEIAKLIAGYRLMVDVRGHVGGAEAASSDDRGLRLSFERAMRVATGLHEAGIEWPRLRVISCGDGDRKRPGGFEEVPVTNERRVEVILTEEGLP